MQSGTVFHLALLRKTSNARRKKINEPQKIVNIEPVHLPQDNYTLSGWSVEEKQFKQAKQIGKQKKRIAKQNTIQDFVQVDPFFTEFSNKASNFKINEMKKRSRHHGSVTDVKKYPYTFKMYKQLENTDIINDQAQKKLFQDCTNQQNNKDITHLRTNIVKKTEAFMHKNQNLNIKYSQRVFSEKKDRDVKPNNKFNKLNISYCGANAHSTQNPTIIYLKKAGCYTSEGKRRNRFNSISKQNSERKQSFSNFVELSNKKSCKKYRRF